MMKILVTGGAGFIASHIVDRYIALGHEVFIIDNVSTGQKQFINPKAQFYEADIRDRKTIVQIFTKIKPQVLNHHAAQMDVRKSVVDPVFDAEVNLLGLLNLLEAGVKNNLQKVIFASSGGAIYGDAKMMPTPEVYPPRPASPYGIAKYASELYLDFYFMNYQIPFVALRYGNVYGPRQNPHGEAGVVAIFTQKLLRGENPVINGDGEQSRDFVFVGDIVEANTKALETDKLQVNIGTGKNTSVNQIFDLLCQLTASSANPHHGPPKQGEQRVSLLDVNLAKSALNWESQVPLEEGLRQTVEFFKHETR